MSDISSPDYALSSEDLKKICPDISVMLYPEVNRFRSLDQLFSSRRDKPIALLYEEQPSYGHWTALIKHGPGQYEFFDPYAMKPDSELKFIPKEYRMQSGQWDAHLLSLINSAPGTTVWSNKQMQSKSPNIATCGRWVSLRCKFRRMPLQDFRKMFLGTQWSPDQLATGFSNMFLQGRY
jgi:hypothetical protein